MTQNKRRNAAHKVVARILAGLLALAVVCAVTACGDKGDEKQSGGVATAIALGHGSCITEVTVVVDKAGKLQKVQFDEIFPASNVYNNTALGTDAPTQTILGKDYYKYLHIGEKYFKVTENGLYVEMGGDNGIEDLMAYYKTPEGMQWYYDSFRAGEMFICAESEEGVPVDDVKLADKYKFNTANGSMRKRYSRYWSTLGNGSIGQVSGLGFNGNMDALENYLLAYGFDAIDDKGLSIELPYAQGNQSGYNAVGGVTTGATLSADTGVYLKTAKAAYEKALAARK